MPFAKSERELQSEEKRERENRDPGCGMLGENVMVRGFDFVFKLVFVGESGCGKTAIVNRYTDDIYVDESAATIGVDFRVKTVTIDGKRLKLTIWDTAGQERFRSIGASYYRGAQLAALVFDLSRYETFAAMPSWIEEIDTQFCTSSDIIKLLIGNKLDKPRQVSKEEASEFAARHNMQYIETSALTNDNVNSAFVIGLKHVLKNERLLKTTPTVVTVETLNGLKKNETYGSGCC